MTYNTKYLEALCQPGCAFLGTRYPILGGAMTWVSERHLVSSISNAGGFGVLACGSMTPDLLDGEIQGTKALTDKPFGVNLITLHPNLHDLIAVARNHGVSHVVLAGGVPSELALKEIKAFARCMAFTPTLALGKRLTRQGVDAIIIEGSEAGGHVGPVSTSVLTQEILPHLKDVPVFVAGGIGHGEKILSYLEMGAAGCQLGTRFVCATESRAHPNFKKVFIRASARDAVVSVQLDPRLTVIPVRALANKGMERFYAFQRQMLVAMEKGEVSQQEAQLNVEHFWAGALRRAVVDGDVEEGSLMAGQSVGMVKKEQSVQEIVDTLMDEALRALEDRFEPFKSQSIAS